MKGFLPLIFRKEKLNLCLFGNGLGEICSLSISFSFAARSKSNAEHRNRGFRGDEKLYTEAKLKQ